MCTYEHELLRLQGFVLEVTPGFEPGNQGFADPCLTTWLCHHYIVRITGRECLFRIPQMKQFVKSIFSLKEKCFCRTATDLGQVNKKVCEMGERSPPRAKPTPPSANGKSYTGHNRTLAPSAAAPIPTARKVCSVSCVKGGCFRLKSRKSRTNRSFMSR